MRKISCQISFFISITLSSCGVLNKASKFQLSDGYYATKLKLSDNKVGKIYVQNAEDTLKIYETLKDRKSIAVDTSKKPEIFLKNQTNPYSSLIFRQPSLDIDFLTILLKYRPQIQGFPNQLNTNLNGAVYVGYRNDYYHIRYKKSPFTFSRYTTHYGFSFGTFAGLGATAINPSVTNNLISSEYDGVIFTKGLAAIIGIDAFTIGLTFGLDNLLDSNKKTWIYESKPWFGLAFGLNLN